MDKKTADFQNQATYKLVGDLFQISALYNSGEETVVTLLPMYDKAKSIIILEDRLKLAGYTYTLQNEEEQIILKLNSKPTFTIPPLNKFLFFITLISIYFVPVFLRYYDGSTDMESLSNIMGLTFQALSEGAGLMFTIAMVSILFVHEMGHYIASRKRHIITSWPYFIPAPNIIGTFGAVIKSKSPFWNRRDLIEVGAWGPIAGWIVALGWTIYGLVTADVEPLINPVESGFLGEPLIFKLLTNLFVTTTTEHYVIVLNEAIFAGWVGMLVTAINMLPIGQLDGGHVIYGLFRKKQHLIAIGAMAGLFILGFESPLWWMFAFMGVIFGVKHPPTLNDNLQISKTAYILAISALLILILSFTPIPFQ